MSFATERRNLTPPQIARLYGVATGKVTDWIKSGDLRALNLARSGCKRPRYSVTPDALEAFERSRQVVLPSQTPRRLRQPVAGQSKDFF